MGATVFSRSTVFKVFSSQAKKIQLYLFKQYGDRPYKVVDLQLYSEGMWGIRVERNLDHWLYGYKIFIGDDRIDHVPITNELVADPYSKHVVSLNAYQQFALTYIVDTHSFEWTDNNRPIIRDPRDLVIYEMHVKDLTAHPSSKNKFPGTYKGLLEEDAIGGLNYLKSLGVNAVELLPIQKFGHYEPAYMEATSDGVVNTWNYYGRNHWGYMTSFFFAPETSFASTSPTEKNAIIGETLATFNEIKAFVNACHQTGIVVIMDVVYNHVSAYDLNPLRFLDKEHYFRLTPEGYFESNSGCGNDFKTESKHARELIVSSLKYWIEEFHIDGFRFDLASLIDWKTVDEIQQMIQKVRPETLLIAEPWALNSYAPTEFGNRGWSAWNDRFRNGVKGIDPAKRIGYIFGNLGEFASRQALENYITGTLAFRAEGLFSDSAKTVNYIESHDGYTIGDFIRLTLNPSIFKQTIEQRSSFIKLKGKELEISRLAALFLFVSQGIVMIHEGQEFGRSKIIAQTSFNDPNTGKIDHDSYNKDNNTNYLNFEEISINQSLFDYYKGLIFHRKHSKGLRKSNVDQIQFLPYGDPLHISFIVHGKDSGDPYNYFCSLNANLNNHYEVTLPLGEWELMADPEQVYTKDLQVIAGKIWVKASGGVLLRTLRKN